MPALNEIELKQKIKSDPVGIYLICGEESFPVKVYTEKLVKASVDESFAGFNLHVFECESTDLDEIYDNSLSVPMMSPSKCVLVKDYPVDEAEDSDLKVLETLLKENPEDNCLIFSYPSAQPKATGIKKLEKLFSQYGSVIKFNKKTPAELSKTLESGAKKRGKSFDRGVSDYLVSCVGNDLNLLSNELEKVCAYAGEVITRKDVDAVCVKTLEARVFDMVNDLVSGNFDRAFRSLSSLFMQREDEFMILGAIISQYVNIYRAKVAFKSGGKVGEIAAAYPSLKDKEYIITKASNRASSMTSEQIEKCIEILAEADIAMKSTQQDKKQILEKTLVRLTRAGGKKI